VKNAHGMKIRIFFCTIFLFSSFHFFPSLLAFLSPSFFFLLHFFSLAAFLPCEVVELRQQNLDFNPEYVTSLEMDNFTVHLMFEVPIIEKDLVDQLSSEEKYHLITDFGRSNNVLSSFTPSSLQGGLAFERGLSEVG
jgi:hypothetical protein